MTKTTDVPNWDENMDMLEENWRSIIRESQDEYKREYLDLYGTMPDNDTNSVDSS